ncbi:MAG TPA: ZIP family metal transporter [Vicinamibacterales bacterium]|nr:ZIP family metal transporter [Vicinamibacterales bacterium]
MRIFAALGLSALGSAGGVLVASLLLLTGDRVRTRVLPSLISYAVGTLLGAALLGLLPEALESRAPTVVFASLLVGIFTFFILEKLVLWRHCHDTADCQIHRSTATLVVIGDGFHALVDGAVIAAAVTVSLPLGVTTALAIAAHEVPQQVGDVAILLGAGYSRLRAFSLNLVAGASAVLGAMVMLMFAEATPAILGYVLGFAAGNFLYVAMADLIPHLHRGEVEGSSVRQVLMIAAGIATIVAL